ncbi:MAG: hypothetical protein GQF41_4550 [Candidatus Rifleibacterium amylolyticum]|nr:MAG: hypothetical protein GQF41_4550 [Candidatus Rifleibacterium amylolyticum]
MTTIASFTPLSPSNFIESYISNEYFINLSSTVRILIAPNPTGPNLAPLAAPSASSIWPVPTYNFDGTIALHIPAHANDENRNTYWSSHYGDGSQPWYRLSWAQPVTISRIFFGHGLPGGGPGSISPGNRGHHTRFIQYYDLASQAWLTIPNSVHYYGYPYPDWVDFRFSPVETTGIVFGLAAGPANPHPNWCVALTEVEVYGSEITVLSADAIPSTLWLDNNGAGSGIVFRATTSESGAVTFKVQTPSGVIILIGSKNTVQQGSEYVAKLSWWGQTGLPEGNYTITAEAGGSSASSSFEVKHVEADLVGLGEWMHDSKDPSAIIPDLVRFRKCPTCPWEQLLSLAPGYFSTLSVSDPVNIVSGNYIWFEEDLILKSRIKLDLARIYNSLDQYNGDFGRGWSCPYLSRLVFQASATVFINSDGSRVKFENTDGTYIAEEGVELKLQYEPSTETYSLSHPYGAVWAFNKNGKIIRMSKGCCGLGALDSVNIDYNDDGQITRVTNPAGQWFEFEYGANEKISKVKDLTGRETAYFYDENNNLVKFIDVIGRETTYNYNDEGFLTEVNQPEAKTTAIEYDIFRVSKLTDPDGAISQFSWNETAPSLTLTDPSGTEHIYQFTEKWRFNGYSVPALAITKTFDSQGKALTGLQNSLGATQAYEYSDGILNRITDEIGYQHQVEYNPRLHLPTKITDSTGREWKYEWCARGNLIAQIDPDGETTSYTYDQYNNKLTEKDPKNRVTTYTYTEGGNFLLSITDPMGDITSFTYDLRGNKVAYKTPLGSITTTEYDALDRETKTVYHDGRWLKTTYSTSGYISGNFESDGTNTTWAHDKSGKILTETTSDGAITSFEYDQAGRRIKTIDPLGNVSETVYDEIGRVVKNIDPAQGFSQNIYDSEGRVIKTIDACGAETTTEYDAAGRVVATTDALGNRSETTYDIAGRVIASKNALGRIIQTVYDENDRVLKTVFPDGSEQSNQYYNDGRTKARIDALGNVTTYEYNQRGQQTKVILPNGAVNQRVYNGMGHEIKKIDPLGRVTETLYDDLLRPYKTVDPASGTVQRFWDPISGLLIAEKQPDNSITSTTYDLLDRPVAQFNANGEPVEFEYDIAGRQVAQIDALGRRTISVYDNLGRETKVILPEGNIISRTYDNCGRMLSLTDGANRTWRWEYDLLGRMTKEIDPHGNSVSYQYNAVGKVISKTNAKQQITQYLYNEMDRLVSIAYPDGTQASFTYDLMGRELTRSGPGGNCIKKYDSVGNLVSEKFSSAENPQEYKGWTYEYDLSGNRIKAIDPEGKVIRYHYNSLNQVVKMELGNNQVINYERNAVGRILRIERSGVETVYNYDPVGRPLEIKHYRLDRYPRKTLIAARYYEFDRVGNILSMKDEDNKATSYSYNSNDWLTEVTYPNSETVAYSYNAAGDRLQESVTFKNKTVSTVFEYDAAGRLIRKGNEAVSYDEDGNLVKIEAGNDVTELFWNSDNRLIRVEKAQKGCKHDKDKKVYGYGHLKHGAESVTYEEYSYLPEDWRRISRKAGQYETRHNGKIKQNEETFISIYDGADESHEYTQKEIEIKDHGCGKSKYKPEKRSSLGLVKEFLSGPGADDIEFTKTGNVSLAMLKDTLGSTIALTGKEGRTVAEIGYDAWGNFKWSDSSGNCPCRHDEFKDYLDRLESTRGFGHGQHDSRSFGKYFAGKLTPYLYTGRRYSEFTNHYLNRNRHYSPQTGRFISKDPIGFNGGYNLYGYAGNNPVTRTDPSGLYEYSLIADDSDWDLRSSANALINGWGAWWPAASARRYDTSNYSSSISLFSDIAKEINWSGKIRTLIFLAHGGYYSGEPPDRLILNKDRMMALTSSDIISIPTAITGFSPICRKLDMFAPGARVIFMSCNVGSGILPQVFANTFLPPYPSFAGGLSIEIGPTWYVGYIHSTRILSSPKFHRYYSQWP